MNQSTVYKLRGGGVHERVDNMIYVTKFGMKIQQDTGRSQSIENMIRGMVMFV